MLQNKVKIITIVVAVIIIGMIWGISEIQKNNRDYEIEEITKGNYFLLLSGDKIGIINKQGEVIIEPTYDNIQIPNPLKPVFICYSNYDKQNNSYDITIKNEKNEEIFTEFDEVFSIPVNGITGNIPFEKSALKYKKDGKYGLISFEGKTITEPIYQEIESLPYKEGEFLVKKDDKYGVINPKGTIMVRIQYDEIIGDGYYDKNYKNAGYIAGTKEEKGYVYSYIKNDGNVILKKEFNDISRINEIEGNDNIYLIVTKNGKKGLYINNTEILECDLQNIEYNEEAKLLIAKRNDLYGVYNLNGDVVLPTENKELSINGIRIVTKNADETKEYDFSGLKIRNNKYKAVYATQNENFFITVNQDNLYGLINKKETEVIENKYTYLEYLTGNYFTAYSTENKIGVLDSDGKLVLDMKYDVIQKIKGSKIIQAIRLDNKTVELYTEDIKQIASKVNANIYIYDNYIKLVSQESANYYTLDGEETTNKALFPNNSLFAVGKNGRWGYEDKDGNIKVNARYDTVTEFNENAFAGIKQNEKWGVVDKTGNIIVEPIYTIEQKTTEPEFIGKYYKVNYGGTNYYTDDVK